MKALLFAIIVLVTLDMVADHGNGVRACLAMIGRLIDHTHSEVSGSVFRS